MRFFHKRDFRSIGQTLDISEDTAQKRVIATSKLKAGMIAALEIAATDTNGIAETNKFRFFRTDDEWKLDILAIVDPASFNFTKTETRADGSETTNRIKVVVQDQKVLRPAPAHRKQ